MEFCSSDTWTWTVKENAIHGGKGHERKMGVSWNVDIHQHNPLSLTVPPSVPIVTTLVCKAVVTTRIMRGSRDAILRLRGWASETGCG